MARKKTSSQSEISENAALAHDENAAPEAAETRAESDAPSPDLELPITGEITVDGEFNDDHVLSRLRNNVLTTSELYAEAQIFLSQNLDIRALLTGNEAILTQNTIEILRILQIWDHAVLHSITSEETRTREIAQRYALFCVKSGLVSSVEVVDTVVELMKTAQDNVKTHLDIFVEKLRVALITLTATQNEDCENHQLALSRLAQMLDIQVVERMLCDPSPSVRVALVRSLFARQTLSVNTVSVLLILLKDRNETVNLSVAKLFTRFKLYPELVIPQILSLLPTANIALTDAIADVLRNYGDGSLEPVMASLEDTDDNMFLAAQQAIAISPQRYTDALLTTLQSARAREFVKDRIIAILRQHKDQTRLADINAALALFPKKQSDLLPEWQPVEHPRIAVPPATDQSDFYTQLLSDDAIRDFATSCDESTLLRLLADASEFAQINALHVVQAMGNVSHAVYEQIAVWLKSSSSQVAQAACSTLITVNPNADDVVQMIINALTSTPSEECQRYFLDEFCRHQNITDAVFRAYYQTPKRCVHIIQYILNHQGDEHVRSNLIHGIDRSQSVACIVESLGLLRKNIALGVDSPSLRKQLLELIEQPVSFGQFGQITRERSIDLLKSLMSKDASPDRETITQIQQYQKECKNSYLRSKLVLLLKSLGEEIFDFEDEDDDFEDLNDEHDDF